MPDYRLYLLNPDSGHIDGVEEFHSADDIEAICLIGQKPRQISTELWCGRHKVARFDADPEMAAHASLADPGLRHAAATN
jgi:hypothetical protein